MGLVGKEVIEIRRLLKAGLPYAEIRKLFNVSDSELRRIDAGEVWAWLDEKLATALEYYYQGLGYGAERTAQELNATFERYKDNPLNKPRMLRLLKRYGIARTPSQAQRKRHELESREVVEERERKRKLTHWKRGTSPWDRIEIPNEKALFTQWSAEGLTQEEMVERLAHLTPPVVVSGSLVADRLGKHRLYQTPKERFPRYVERGIVGVKAPPHEETQRNYRKSDSAIATDIERKRAKKAFPSPLGKCELGRGDAFYRFRIDFWDWQFVDKESRHLIAFLCRRHAALVTRRRGTVGRGLRHSPKGLPKTLESGQRIIEYYKRNPTNCTAETMRTCQNCGKKFPVPTGKTTNFCGHPCQVADQSRRLSEEDSLLFKSRVIQLHLEGLSERDIVKEMPKRWATYYNRKSRPTPHPVNKTGIHRIILEWKQSKEGKQGEGYK